MAGSFSGTFDRDAAESVTSAVKKDMLSLEDSKNMAEVDGSVLAAGGRTWGRVYISWANNTMSRPRITGQLVKAHLCSP